MHIYEKKSAFSRVFAVVGAILPCLFWGLVIFGFEEKSTAICTIASALLHEIGHLLYICIIKKEKAKIKSVSNGFKISYTSQLSYKEEMWLYLSGPLFNVFIAILSLLLCFILKDIAVLFSLINLASALSNLIPIEGYDGYGAIRCWLEEKEVCDRYFRFLSFISQFVTIGFCLISLYLIDRLNGGYWIFAVFFALMIKHIKKELRDNK